VVNNKKRDINNNFEFIIIVVVNLILLLSPIIIISVFTNINYNIHTLLFLFTISLWCLIEYRVHSPQNVIELPQNRWMPKVYGYSILGIMWVSLFENVLQKKSPHPLFIGGLIFCVLGISLRYFSIKRLGKYFLDEIEVLTEHKLVTTGIYSYIRHPSETGMLFIIFGSSLLLGSTIGVVLCILVLTPLIIMRINLEDNLLMSNFGEDFFLYKKEVFPFIPKIKIKKQKE
jgi:protein-S-isoprenylcysteine O-methyltransferase Ste14